MIILVAIVVGVVFAVVGIRKGFFSTWAILFNILISIYLSIMITPVLVDRILFLGRTSYHVAGCVVVVGIVFFAILHTIASSFLTETFEVSFPKLFNSAAAAILGFLTGYLLLNFVLFAICITPVSQQPIMKIFCGDDALGSVTMPAVRGACNFVNKVSLQRYEDGPKKAAELLLVKSQNRNDPNKVR